MASRKKAEPPAIQPPVDEVLNPSADALVAEYFTHKDFVAAQSEQFNQHIKPYRDRMEFIENKLLEMLNGLGGDKGSLKTDHGTAYKSAILNVKVDVEAGPYIDPDTGTVSAGREALLDFALANWDTYGNEMLLVNPQKDAVRRYMDENDGRPPPGISTSVFTRVNIRRS